MVPGNFKPTILHPLYIIRKGLFNKISLYSPQLQGKLLDFGCGEKPYRELFVNVTTYIGLDYDGGGHDHTDENVDVYYDGKTIPFSNETFDSFFSSEVFEHVFTLQEILPEINRVIKPGGKMLITCPFAWEEHEVPFDYARYTQYALIDLLKKNGFLVLKIDKNGHFISALHQIFILYLTNEWIHRVIFFSRFNFFKKIIRQLLVPFLNASFLLFERLWPKSEKFYLNTIILAEKNP